MSVFSVWARHRLRCALVPLGAVLSWHPLSTPLLSVQQLAAPAGGSQGGRMGNGEHGVGKPEPWPEMSPFVWPKVPLSNHFHNGEAPNPD